LQHNFLPSAKNSPVPAPFSHRDSVEVYWSCLVEPAFFLVCVVT
jgi:hypothetical protein